MVKGLLQRTWTLPAPDQLTCVKLMSTKPRTLAVDAAQLNLLLVFHASLTHVSWIRSLDLCLLTVEVENSSLMLFAHSASTSAYHGPIAQCPSRLCGVSSCCFVRNQWGKGCQGASSPFHSFVWRTSLRWGWIIPSCPLALQKSFTSSASVATNIWFSCLRSVMAHSFSYFFLLILGFYHNKPQSSLLQFVKVPL